MWSFGCISNAHSRINMKPLANAETRLTPTLKDLPISTCSSYMCGMQVAIPVVCNHESSMVKPVQ